MNRRQFLGSLALLGGVTGCVSAPVAREAPGEPTSERAGSAPPTGGRPPRFGDVELPVARTEMVRATPRDAIPAITDPAFASDWTRIDRTLGDSHLVVGVVRDGTARAYPLSVLGNHEVVNDEFGGPLLVTYCPVCASAVVAGRRVAGEPTQFGVSGLLYRSDLVLYDRRTDSLWSQIMATAVNGPARGTRLDVVPSSLTTWGEWRGDRPDSEVLLPAPESETVPAPTDSLPPAGSPGSGHVGVGATDRSVEDDRLEPRTLVVGVATGSTATAYPTDPVRAAGVVNDRVGGLPVVVAAGTVPQAYDRRIGGETLSFEPAAEGRMRAGGSEWSITTGEAVSGPYEGRRLARATGVTTTYWFAWVDFHPGTGVYGVDP